MLLSVQTLFELVVFHSKADEKLQNVFWTLQRLSSSVRETFVAQMVDWMMKR